MPKILRKLPILQIFKSLSSASRRLASSQSNRHVVIFVSMILNSFYGLSGAMTCAGIERFTVECSNQTLNFTQLESAPQYYLDTICDTPQVSSKFRQPYFLAE